MKQYISEDRAIYEDEYHGLFSRKLAEWAISKMRMKDPTSERMRPVPRRTVEEVKEVLEANNIDLPKEYLYTAWYIYHMALADNQKSLKTDAQRAEYIEETICDPDGDPTNVLACFEAKMCNARIPIYWDMMM